MAERYVDPFLERMAQQEVQARQVTTDEDKNSSSAGDFVDAFQEGMYQSAAGDAEAIGQVSDSDTFKSIGKALARGADNQTATMTDEGRQALSKHIYKQDQDSLLGITFDEGATDWRTWALQFGVLGGQVAANLATGFGAGSVVKAGAKTAIKAFAKEAVTKEAQQLVAKNAVKEAIRNGALDDVRTALIAAPDKAAMNAVLNKATSRLGGIATTAVAGSMAAGMRAQQARDEYLGLDADTLNQNPEFQKAYWEIADNPENQGLDTATIHNAAKEMLAEKAATSAFYDKDALLSDFAASLYTPFGGGVIGRGAATASKLGRFGIGLAEESATESWQGGETQRAVNEAIKEWGDESRDPMANVVRTRWEEGTLGGVFGGMAKVVEGQHVAPSKPIVTVENPPSTGNSTLDSALAQSNADEQSRYDTLTGHVDELSKPAYMRNGDISPALESAITRFRMDEFNRQQAEQNNGVMQPFDNPVTGNPDEPAFLRSRNFNPTGRDLTGNEDVNPESPVQQALARSAGQDRSLESQLADTMANGDQGKTPQEDFVTGEWLRWDQRQPMSEPNRIESGVTMPGESREILPESRGLGYSGTINMPGNPGNGINDNYVPPITQDRTTGDKSLGIESTRDPRSPVAQAIAQAGTESDSIFGQLKSLRVTKRGKPFGSVKEAQLASRKTETPIALPTGGFGVVDKTELEQVQASQNQQLIATPQADVNDTNVADINQPADSAIKNVLGVKTEKQSNNDGSSTYRFSFNDGHASVLTHSDGTAHIMDVQIGDGETAGLRGKGVGTKLYEHIGNELAKDGVTLESTRWSKHKSAISPAALRVWEKLEKAGAARVVGHENARVLDRFSGVNEVRDIPIYEFTSAGKEASQATVKQIDSSESASTPVVAQNQPDFNVNESSNGQATADQLSVPATSDTATTNESVKDGQSDPDNLNIIEHTTGKNKIIRGVVRKDLTVDEAKAIDPYTFKKDGGYFIREKHLDKLPPVKASTEQAKVENQPEPEVTTATNEILSTADGKPTETVQEQSVKPSKEQFADNKLFTADKVAAARARLKSKMGNLNSGIDPEIMIDGMTIAGAYIESGVRSFTAYAKAMTDDFGDSIKPFLLSFWEGARHYPGLDTEGMTSTEESAKQHAELMRGEDAPSKAPARKEREADNKTESYDERLNSRQERIKFATSNKEIDKVIAEQEADTERDWDTTRSLGIKAENRKRQIESHEDQQKTNEMLDAGKSVYATSFKSGQAANSYVEKKNKEDPDFEYTLHEPTMERQHTDFGEVTDSDWRVTKKRRNTSKPEKTIEDHFKDLAKYQSGEMDFDEFKQAASDFLDNEESVKAKLAALTKPEILKRMGPMFNYNHKGDKKDVIVDAAYQSLAGQLRFAAHGDKDMITETVSFEEIQGKRARKTTASKAREEISALTSEKYGIYQEKAKAATKKAEERFKKVKQQISDPQTLDDFETFLNYRSIDKLTPEQKARYEDLKAERNLDKRDQAAAAAKETKVVPTATGDIVKTKHTKEGHDLFVVKLADRVDRDAYTTINAKAKELGGYYSKFRGNGAVPGFQFRTEEQAQEFQQWLSNTGNETSSGTDLKATTDITAEPEVPTEESSKKKQAAKLRDRAASVREKAQAELNAERKANTVKRAREAAYAVARAEADLRFANILDAIANGIEAGEIKYLRNMTTGTQLETLDTVLRRIVRSNKMSQAIRDDLIQKGYLRKGDDAELSWTDSAPIEVITQYAEMPGMDYWANILRDTAKNMQTTAGFKQAGVKIMNQVLMAINAENRMVTISDPDLIEKLKQFSKNHEVRDYLKDTMADYDRLVRMGITSPIELRAALRELHKVKQSLKGTQPKRDPVKQKEDALKMRLLNNRNAFVDFFPTPDEHANDVIARAGIEPGMRVLEPSAGHGALAVAARDAGATVDAVELSNDLRDILTEKGFNLVGSDFMATEPAGEYDAVVMNPPFSNDMDIDHVKHAYAHLKPGGRLVAIVSSMAGERSNNKNKQFKEWLDSLGATEEMMPEGSFKNSMNPTSVRTKIIELQKPSDSKNVKNQPMGSRVTIHTPKGKPVEVQYQLVSAADLVASNEFDGRVNKSYPQELQPRDRTKASYQQQVNQIAANPEGSRLAGSPESDRGAPIVRDLVVESGNGRTIGIKQAYKQGTATEYRDYLIKHADEFGFTADDVNLIDDPVLVRQRVSDLSPEERLDFVVDSNTDAKMANSATEDAKSDARYLDNGMMDLLNIPEGGDLLAASNERFLSAFATKLGSNSLNNYKDSSGRWNESFRKRVSNAIFAYGYDNDTLLKSATGDTSEAGKNLTSALMNNAASVAELRSMVPETAKAFVNYLAEGIDVMTSAKRNGQSIQEVVNQGDMLSGGVSHYGGAIAEMLADASRSGKRLTEMLNQITGMLNESAKAADQIDLLTGEPTQQVTAEEAINAAEKYFNERKQQEQRVRPSQDLFGANSARIGDNNGSGTSVSRPVSASETKSAGENSRLNLVNGLLGGETEKAQFSKMPLNAAEKSGKGMTKPEAELAAKEWLKQFKTDIGVKVVRNQAEFNQMLEDMGQSAVNADEVANAAYLPESKTLLLNASAIQNPARLRQLMRHEILGHHGLEYVIGKGAVNDILQILKNGYATSKAIRDAVDTVAANYADADVKTKIKEAFAHYAENRPVDKGAIGRLWDRVVDLVKSALVKAGFIKPNEAEQQLDSLLKTIAEQMRQGRSDNGPNGGTGNKAYFSKGKNGDTSAYGQAGSLLKESGSSLVNWLKQQRGRGLGTLTDLQIDQIYRDITGGAINRYQKLRTKMESDRNDILLEAETKYEPMWEAMPEKEKAALSQLMYDATMSSLHPDKPLEDNSLYKEAKDKLAKARTEKTKAEYQAELDIIRNNYRNLSERYRLSSKQSKEMYGTMRDLYAKQWETLRKAIEQRIEDQLGEGGKALASQMRLRMEHALQHGPYFPLARFGNYVVKARKDGEYIREHFEKRKDAEAALKQYRGEGYNAVMTVKETSAGDQANAHALGMEVIEALDKAQAEGTAPAELKDTVWQAMLDMLPDSSYAKHAIHRKRIKGASRDGHRAYLQSVYHFAHHVSKIRYGHQMKAELDGMKEQVQLAVQGEESNIKPDEAEIAQQVLNEMNLRHEMNMNPKGSALAGQLGNLGFMFYLGASPASAMINLTQNVTVMLPQLAGKYGFVKAAKFMLQAMVDYMRHGVFQKGTKEAWVSLTRATNAAITADEKAMLNKLYKAGVLDLTQAHSIAARADTDQQNIKPGKQWARTGMRWAGALFHNAEVLNREVAALTAYRLMKAQQPGIASDVLKGDSAAIDQVAEMVYDGHGNYAASNRPRYMRSDVMKVLTQFKIYSQMMTYTLARNAVLAAKGDKTALKTLGVMFGTTWMMAGMMGMPTPVGLILYGLASLFDDDDDRTGEASFRLGLTEVFGAEVGELIAKGPVDAISGLNISGRTGLSDLWWRSPKEGTEGDDLTFHYVQQIAGPVLGIGVSAVRGMREFANGDIQRGVEAMSPKAVKDLAKAYRQATEGEQTRNGDSVIDDVGAWNVAMQAMGFSSAKMSQVYAARGYIKGKEKVIEDERSNLLADFFDAKRSGDEEAMRDVMERIKAFNSKHDRAETITGRTLMQSIKSRNRSMERTQAGVYLSKKREYLRGEGAFLDDEDDVE